MYYINDFPYIYIMLFARLKSYISHCVYHLIGHTSGSTANGPKTLKIHSSPTIEFAFQLRTFSTISQTFVIGNETKMH